MGLAQGGPQSLVFVIINVVQLVRLPKSVLPEEGPVTLNRVFFFLCSISSIRFLI